MSVAVKICGLTEARGLKAAVEAGAAYIGFNFFRRSPRYIDVEAAAAFAGLVPRGVKCVGLFVDPTDMELENVTERVPLDIVQLHGDETPGRVAAIKSLTGLRAMKALGIATARDVIAANAYETAADMLLFDAKPPADATRPGGNAIAFDWGLMRTYAGPLPWMLAGGLTRVNVGDALKVSGARMVDVASGVESKPGLKSPAKIRAFIAAVNAAQGA